MADNNNNNNEQAAGNQGSESEPLSLEKSITEGYLPRLDEHKSILRRYLQFSPAAASEIARQAELFSLDEYYRLTDTGHDSSSLEAMEFSHAHDIYKFYGAISEILLKSSPLETQALVKIFGRGRTPKLSLWPSQHKENLVRKLIDFRISLSALLLPESIEELTTLAWHSSQMHNEGTFALENMDCISKMYLTLSDLINTDRLGLGKKTIARIVQLYKLPVPVLKGVSRKEQREIEERLIQSYGHSNKYRSPVSSKLEKISAAIQQYHQYFDSRETLRLPVNDLAGLILKECKREEKAKLGSMTWEDFDSTRLESFFKVISYDLCKSLEEVMECVELNLKLEDSGYQVQCRITSSGTFKKVYLAEDRLGSECVLKEIIDERVVAVLKSKVTPQEMTRKELKSSPFQMQHPHINPIVPLFMNDRVYFLEPKYEQTMEELVRKLHQGRVFGKAPEGKGTVLLYPYSEKVIRLMHQLASALEYCHERNVIHGDFKLDNVGIRRDKEGGEQVLLSDFGMATYDKHLTGEEEFTYNKGRVYTKHPDQFRGGGHPDKSTDAFSFGAELFYLCTGRYPFSEELADFSLEAEKLKYLKRVHTLIKAGTWKEVLKENIDKFMPEGFEIGYPVRYFAPDDTRKHFPFPLEHLTVPEGSVIISPFLYERNRYPVERGITIDTTITKLARELLDICFFKFDPNFGQDFLLIQGYLQSIQEYISKQSEQLAAEYHNFKAK